jgi:hypothetical protein
MTQSYDPLAALRQEIRQALNTINTRVNDVAAFARGSEGRLQDLQGAMDRVTSIRQGMSAPGVVRIEDLPGRRVPFVLLAEVPVTAGSVTTQQTSITISQDGPFVAVRRMATFLSALEYQVTATVNESTITTRYSGRSFGRFRPIHSAWDIMDASAIANTETFQPVSLEKKGVFPNGVFGVPSSRSPFRTMEFDGRISVINAGSSYPRQNIPVPSSMWTPQINAPQDLGALDFFERGETITFSVTPTHENNPNFGNATGDQFNWLLQPSGYPFVAGQYDCQEGIVTPSPWVEGEPPPYQTLTEDSVVRSPDGVLILGYEGYRIIQPVAP